MFSRKKARKVEIKAPKTLVEDAKKQIYEYAKEKTPSISGRQQLVDLHRGMLRKDPRSCRSNCYMSFLAEVDNPCPDLILRSKYREEVIKKFEE